MRPHGRIVLLILILLAGGFSLSSAAGSRAAASPTRYAWWLYQPCYTGNPCTSYVYASVIARDPLHLGTIYIGADDYQGGWLGASAPSGGIYRSLDSGRTWQYLARPDPHSSIAKILVHPTKTNILIAAYGYTPPYDPGGIYRSVDGGTTWSRVLPHLAIGDVVFDPTEPAIIYATGEVPSNPWGIYRSTDTGQTWSRISEQGLAHIAVNPAAPTILVGTALASTSPPQMFRSTDSGVSWTSQPYPPGTSGGSRILINPQNPNRMYSFNSPYDGIWRTDDAGQTWTDVGVALPNTGFGHTVISASFDPRDPDILWIGLRYAGPFVSPDGGDTWYDETHGIIHFPLGDDCWSFALATTGEHAVDCEGLFYTIGPEFVTHLPTVQRP